MTWSGCDRTIFSKLSFCLYICYIFCFISQSWLSTAGKGRVGCQVVLSWLSRALCSKPELIKPEYLCIKPEYLCIVWFNEHRTHCSHTWTDSDLSSWHWTSASHWEWSDLFKSPESSQLGTLGVKQRSGPRHHRAIG